MEDLVFIMVIFLSFLLLWGVLAVFYTVWWKPTSLEKLLKQQGITGSPYKLYHGELKEYVRSLQEARTKPMSLTNEIVPRVIPFVKQQVETHGKITFYWVGTTPRMIIADPELMKEILSNKFGHFQKPPLNPLTNILTMGLSWLEREKWAKHRRIMSPAFHMEKLKGMMPQFTACCSELIERWEKLVGPQGSCELDVWPELSNLTSDVISRAAFGSKLEEGKKIFELQKEMIVLVIEASQSVYIPGFRFIPTKKNKRRMKLDKEIKDMLREIIHKKEQGMRIGESSGDDLLSMMLQSNSMNYLHENAKESTTNGMSIEEVIEECKLFYFAGQETTSTWLTWTMVVLAMHPNWQEKARDEVLQICGKNTPNFKSINHLKIVTMILNEVLRLYPPAVHQFRHTYKEMKIGGITLPAGVELMLPTLLINHNPELWGEDAEKFRPDRFSEGIMNASKNQGAFLPFGWGPRICLGQNFALIEAKMALAMILQHFSFQLSPTYAHAPYTIITLQPQHGAQVILHRI
ncbi:hypothetical protein GIB67_035555 [Kingdonia uniflora]|uniref:Cytochrome P450 n=1 Tax=Kingdonia uniflora TaxID=39325 RepID=A0A7J7LD67_9MAGN|nr:hypothetical protein GIB67_035555 [Kingdonia uniflora]